MFAETVKLTCSTVEYSSAIRRRDSWDRSIPALVRRHRTVPL